MIHKFPEEVIEKAICKAFEIGAKSKAIQLGEEPEYISQRKAYLRYGEGNVDRWVRRGAVKRLKDSTKPNARVRFSVMELEKAAYSINVMSSLSPISNAEIADVVSEILHTK